MEEPTLPCCQCPTIPGGLPMVPSRPAWRWRRPSCLWRGSSLRTDAWPRVVWCWREFDVAWCCLREAGLLGAYPKIPWTRGTRTWFSWIGLPILGCAILTILTPRNCPLGRLLQWPSLDGLKSWSQIIAQRRCACWQRHLGRCIRWIPIPATWYWGKTWQDYLILSIYWPRIHVYSMFIP